MNKTRKLQQQLLGVKDDAFFRDGQ